MAVPERGRIASRIASWKEGDWSNRVDVDMAPDEADLAGYDTLVVPPS